MTDNTDRLLQTGKLQDLFSHSQDLEQTKEKNQVLKPMVSYLTSAFIGHIPIYIKCFKKAYCFFSCNLSPGTLVACLPSI